MAEIGGALGGDNRRIIIIATIIAIVLSLFSLVFMRSCSSRSAASKYIVIFKNLDLKDSANVVTRLKELKIEYETKDEGKSVAVARDKVDEARLGLAEKNLPLGGAVGWEIFDQSKLGATDFDRQVQFVRAISGELSRTIRHIQAIEDARVQIVIPKAELFEVTKSPVTAAVLLQLKPGKTLSKEQVDGIVYLVASSVENLRPENVTIVDVFGNILSGGPSLVQQVITEKTQPTPEAIEAVQARTIEIKTPVQKELTHEEKVVLLIKARQGLEEDYIMQIQKLLNQFYPPNAVIVRVNLDIVPKLETFAAGDFSSVMENIKKVNVVLLVDNKFELTKQIKKTTFKSIAGTINYNKKRGDIIKLYRVPFYYASTYSSVKDLSPIRPPQQINFAGIVFSMLLQKGFYFIVFILICMIIALVIFVRPMIFGVGAKTGTGKQSEGSIIDKVRNAAFENPERVAAILKKWLEEGH